MPKSNMVPRSVGIDVSKAKIDVAILFDTAEYATQQFTNQNEAGIQECIDWLKSHNIQTKTSIVIESTGSYHWLVCLLLSEAGYLVHLINPLLTKKYQRGSIRGAKTDTIDAKRLAEIGMIEHDLPIFFDTRDSLTSKKYQTLYAKLTKVKQQLSRSYRDAVESAEIIGTSLQLETVEECLHQIQRTLNTLKKIIEENTSEMARQVAEIKGVSAFQASVICNAVEGRKFRGKNQLIAFFGLDVQVKESGAWKGKFKLSKRGNSFYRMVLFQLGWSLSRHNEEFHEYYQRLRDDGKHYYTCLISTARKFLKYFYEHFLKPYYQTTLDLSL
jgi:transposase